VLRERDALQNPDRQWAAKREHARRARAAGVERKRGTPLVSGEMRLATTGDVLGVIEGQVAAVLADTELGTTERARTIATLVGIALRAIEQAESLRMRLETTNRPSADGRNRRRASACRRPSRTLGRRPEQAFGPRSREARWHTKGVASWSSLHRLRRPYR
jgi:hypothetical protein